MFPSPKDYKYSEEPTLWSGRFSKDLEMRMASEWSFEIPVVSESVKMGELAICMFTEGGGGSERKKRKRSMRRQLGKQG